MDEQKRIAEDVEGQRFYSDRDLKHDVTPVASEDEDTEQGPGTSS